MSTIVTALTANSAQWAKTVLFATYDENGGFFDHVPPITAPPGTPGEYVTAPAVPDPAAVGNPAILGPIGLGFRVPMLIISPFSRGGFVSSDLFDHTSVLRFLETRFGAEVPNLSAWRRSAVGDLTSASISNLRISRYPSCRLPSRLSRKPFNNAPSHWPEQPHILRRIRKFPRHRMQEAPFGQAVSATPPQLPNVIGL